MNKNLNRRDFTKRTSAAVGGILTGTLLGSRPSIGQDGDMSHKRLLLLGLNALARAHQLDYFADGHRGAGMVSAYLLCVDDDLDKDATSRIVELVDINWASSTLCKPFLGAKPEPERITEIGVALAEGGEVLRQVGHNAIFAMLAIRAFRLMPSAAYWKRRGDTTVGIGHVFKYPYAYYDLLRRARDPELRRASDAKAYHLF